MLCYDAYTVDIPLGELKNLDEMFFRQVQMKSERVLKKFANQYDVTRRNIFSQISAKGIYTILSIDNIENENIYLENGFIIKNKMLSNIFKTSERIVFCAITIYGYEEIENKVEDNLEMLFYDAWGTAVAECGHVWLKNHIRNNVKTEKNYFTNSWSPGQHNIDIELQRTLFKVLKPETIGITLNDSCMMDPKKSISSFMGISKSEDVEQIRACDFCSHRETCPSAYV